MKMNHILQHVLFAFFFLFTMNTYAQVEEAYDREKAYADIRTLSEGVLVVRLESEERKINALREKGSASAGARQQIEAEIQSLIEERDSFNVNLIRAFAQEFTFCPVYFIYDTDSRNFLEGNRVGIFLNFKARRDSTIQWSQKSYLGLRSGEALNGPEGLVVTDGRFRDLPNPFPGFVKKNSAGSIFNWLLARDIYYVKNAERMVGKLQRKLTNFYEQARQ